jgi:hypothetical protein
MTPGAASVPPSRIGVWLVNLFTPAEQAESIVGDLLEEYSDLATKSGVAFARRWYRRQTVKTVAHLVVAGFRDHPWSMAAAVMAGFLLLRFGLLYYGHATAAVMDRYRVYEHIADLGRRQPSVNVAAAYMFWITRGTLLGRLLVETLVGGTIAAAARGREMTASLALALFWSALGVAGCLMMAATTGDYKFLLLWALPTVLADSIAVLVGGAIVRKYRSAAAPRPAAT